MMSREIRMLLCLLPERGKGEEKGEERGEQKEPLARMDSKDGHCGLL